MLSKTGCRSLLTAHNTYQGTGDPAMRQLSACTMAEEINPKTTWSAFKWQPQCLLTGDWDKLLNLSGPQFAFIQKHIHTVLVAQSRPTLCDHMNCSPPGSSVHGISQARILEGVAIPFSKGSSQPRDQNRVSALQAGSLPLASASTCDILESIILVTYLFTELLSGFPTRSFFNLI